MTFPPSKMLDPPPLSLDRRCASVSFAGCPPGTAVVVVVFRAPGAAGISAFNDSASARISSSVAP
jgi:hypothetical protein